MNRSFATGAATGTAATLLAVLAVAVLRPARPPEPDRRPARLREVEERVVVLERELAAARRELRLERARADELRIRLEREAPAPGPFPDPAPREPRPADRARTPSPGAEAAPAAAGPRELKSLRSLQLGKELPREVVEWLDLDPGQARVVNDAFVEDGKHVYASLRTLAAAELPWLKQPPEDGYKLALTVYQVMDAEPAARERWEAWRRSLLEIRRRTLEHVSAALREAQREKLASLLADYFSFEGAFTFTASR
jgi:hypothetical protein